MSFGYPVFLVSSFFSFLLSVSCRVADYVYFLFILLFLVISFYYSCLRSPIINSEQLTVLLCGSGWLKMLYLQTRDVRCGKPKYLNLSTINPYTNAHPIFQA
jgi:hypothetical protein